MYLYSPSAVSEEVQASPCLDTGTVSEPEFSSSVSEEVQASLYLEAMTVAVSVPVFPQCCK